MSGTDRAQFLINLLPSEDVCVLKSKAKDDHWEERREGEGTAEGDCSDAEKEGADTWKVPLPFVLHCARKESSVFFKCRSASHEVFESNTCM